MSTQKIDVVVDAGGSRVRAHAYQHDIAVTTFEIPQSANPIRMGIDHSLMVIESTIEGLLKRLGPISLRRIACGIAGAGRPDLRETMIDSLSRRFFCDVFVCSDAESVLEAAVESGPVSVLIAGTGAIAAGRRATGGLIRAGGFGCPGGDPGSGRWLAQQAKMAFGRQLDRSLTDFEIGPWVESMARAGHEGAIDLLRSCASHLVRLLVELAPDPGPLVTEGGLILHSSVVRTAFTERLSQDFPHLVLQDPWRQAHWGALSLARRSDSQDHVWWA